mmetsp:Transcript_19884/g.24589  ORF Transcript_19884/g.24589 Transcript_19884/m.24589 type:complete len:99 (+) Transcript_19884:289-585(+)
MANISSQAIKRSHFIFPSNESTVWLENLYELAWGKNLADRVILLVQTLMKDKQTGQMKPIGYSVHDLLNPDGKVKYGTFTEPLLLPPISFRDLDSNPS